MINARNRIASPVCLTPKGLKLSIAAPNYSVYQVRCRISGSFGGTVPSGTLGLSHQYQVLNLLCRLQTKNSSPELRIRPLELVAKPHKRFMTIMIQAIWMKASYMETWCSYRTTMRRKFPNQLNVRSTVYRLLYRSQRRSSCLLTFL